MRALQTFYPGDDFVRVCGTVAVQFTVIFVIAALLALLCFRRHAAARHALWAIGLCCMLLSPLIASLWNGSEVALIELPVLEPLPTAPAAVIETEPPRPSPSSLWEERFDEAVHSAKEYAVGISLDPQPEQPPAIARSATNQNQPARAASSTAKPRTDRVPTASHKPPDAFRLGVSLALLVWVTGFFYHVLRFWHGWRNVRRFRHETQAFSYPNLSGVLDDVRQSLGGADLPPIYVSKLATVPMVAGYRAPAVLLPAGTASLARDELRDVLVHECAHVLRRDQSIGLLQVLAAALFWPHPLVHLLNRRLSQAREEACDDYVIQTADPRNYARLLLSYSQRQLPANTGPAALAMITRRGKLEHRIAGLLDARRRRIPYCGRLLMAVLALILLTGGILVAGTRLSSSAQEEQGSEKNDGNGTRAIEANDADDAKPTPPVKLAKDQYGDLIPAGAMARLGTVKFRHYGWHKYVGFAADNETVLSCSSDTKSIRFWNALTGKLLREVRMNMGGSRWFRMSPDRRTAAVLGFVFVEADKANYRVIELWDVESCELKSTIRWAEKKSGESLRLEFTPDGKTLVVGDSHGTLTFWDVADGVELLRYQLTERTVGVKGLAVSPDSQLMAAATRDGLYLWDWLSGEAPEKIDQGRDYSGLAFSPDSRLLAVGGDTENEVRLLDVSSREIVRTFKNDTETAMHIEQLAFTPDGISLVAANHISIRKAVKSVLVWDVATGELRHNLTTGSMVPRCLDISADGRLVVAGDWNGQLAVWDLATGKETVENTSEKGHQNNISAISFSQDSNSVITASDDGTARVWDADTSRQTRTLKHGHWIRAMALSPDDTQIATSSLDNTVALWDASDGRMIQKLPGNGQSGGRRALVFSPDGRRLAAWGDDLQLKIWDAKTGKNLHEFPIRPSGIIIPKGTTGANAKFDYTNFRSVDGWGFSNDATTLMLIFQRSVYVFDVATGQERKTFELEFPIYHAAISPNAKWLLTSGPGGSRVKTEMANGGVRLSGAANHVVRMYDLQTGAQKWEYVIPSQRGAGPVVFSADGKIMAAAFRQPHDEIRFWAVETGEELATIKNVTGISRVIAFSPHREKFACAMRDGDVLIWDLQELGLKKSP